MKVEWGLNDSFYDFGDFDIKENDFGEVQLSVSFNLFTMNGWKYWIIKQYRIPHP